MSAWPFALAAAGGVLHFLGYIGFGVWPLALVSLACLWGALEATRTRGLLVGASVGLLTGLVLGWPRTEEKTMTCEPVRSVETELQNADAAP